MENPYLLLLILGGILLLLAVAYLAAVIFAFRFAFLRGKTEGRKFPLYENDQLRPFRKMREDAMEYANNTPYETVTIRSCDGLTLSARLYDVEGAVGTILLFHGYRSFGECDFGCILPYYRDTRRLRLLLVDQRAHGDSEGKYITFGTLERRDAADWARYIEGRFGPHPILLDGISMGGATVLLAAAEPLPESVIGILADCAYSSPAAILCAVGKQMKLPVGLILPGVRLLCRTIAHFDPIPVSVPEALRKSNLPVLMIHGTADGFVPYEMGVENSRARADIRFVAIEGADHGMSYLIDPDTVLRELGDFFDRHLPSPKPTSER